ncbi:MAG: hypothetical protein WEF86_00580 [Gemmatimonadota bacterium]
MQNEPEDRVPDTESRGSLEPPRRPPPTAVGAATPDPEPPPRRGTPYMMHRSVSVELIRVPLLVIRLLVRGAGSVLRRQLQKIRS